MNRNKKEMDRIKKGILKEIKKYHDDTTDPGRQKLLKKARAKGLSQQFIGFYSTKDPNPLSEFDIFFNDKEFMSKAIKINPWCVEYASQELKDNLSIAKLIYKKDKNIAKKYISKEILKKIK